MALLDALLLDPSPFEVWIARRTDGIYGSGTLNDPWDGSTTDRFDKILSNLPANTPTTVHIGPGTFTTKGYTDDPATTSGWEIKPGVRIVGSGMGVTTLKLDFNPPASLPANPAQHFAVGHRLLIGTPAVFNPVDFCEVSDLTIDCDLALQSDKVAACGLRLMGNHVRVTRVKAINWGTLTGGPPCFVVQLITAHTDAVAGRIELQDAVIDGCVATTLWASRDAGTVTVFHVGGAENAALQMEAYGLAPVIRNCFVDGTTNDPDGFDPLAADVRALSMGWCRAGIVEGNQLHNVQTGGPYQDKATTREIVVRGNTYKNVLRGPWWKLGGLGSSMSITAFALIGSIPSTVVEATCAAHNLSPGERVRVSGASIAGLNGVFLVSYVSASDKFRYVLETSLSSVSGTATVQKVYGASNILVEHNVLELAPSGALAAIQLEDGAVGTALGLNQGPDFTYTEAIVRANQVRYLNTQPDGAGGYGTDLAGIKDVIIRDQILEVMPADGILLKDIHCRNVTYFNNRAPTGDLVQGYNVTSMSKYGELETEAEDALVWSIL